MAFLCSALISGGRLTGEGRKQAFVCDLGERVRRSWWTPPCPGGFGRCPRPSGHSRLTGGDGQCPVRKVLQISNQFSPSGL